MINSKKLIKLKFISHGFFGKKGGKSEGIYKSLNCGPGSNDKKKFVKKNLKIVRRKIGKNTKDIFLLHQVHSNKFIFLEKNKKIPKKSPIVDAIITNQEKLPIAVLTADCVPILLCDYKLKFIAAIHSGWKSAYKGIISKVIKFMVKKGCSNNNIIAAIGPCISQKNYEVKKDFFRRFVKKNKNNKKFFKMKKKMLFFNLSGYVKSQLKLNKITNIDLLNIDTFNNKNNFFSARRSLKLKHDDYGRNISIIMIN